MSDAPQVRNVDDESDLSKAADVAAPEVQPDSSSQPEWSDDDDRSPERDSTDPETEADEAAGGDIVGGMNMGH
jgi:hypothetical protein